MSHHLYVLGATGNYLGYSCWAWVDYYYLLTGFFTAKHFKINQGHKYVSENLSKDVMCYTLKKFKSFAPYVLVAVLVQYIIELCSYALNGHIVYGLRNIVVDMPYEILCLSSTGLVYAKLAPIWYLSAMLIALPIVIYCMLKFKDIWYIASWVIPILYYGRYGLNTAREWPNDMLRAFICITLGTFVYLLAVELNKVKIHSNAKKIAFTVCEIGCWMFTAYITIFNKNMLNFLVLLWVVHCVIMFSGKSMTYSVRSRFFIYLGELSLPMFLTHWAIGCLMNMIIRDFNTKILLYYIVTIGVSIVLLWIKKKFIMLYKKDL